jgi:hypothetical protein
MDFHTHTHTHIFVALYIIISSNAGRFTNTCLNEYVFGKIAKNFWPPTITLIGNTVPRGAKK